ncbi:MAG: TrkA family potassium uptake protein [Lachnospiraceae bacterium]|jgi:trk system potassium uptake protein TrkA|nr:TrkA family potassium uptake protein [Lachnospiraceae bacterium]MDD5860139.1 TrkA family potassium uptake protein [Eubacteriales bacterium]MCI1333936.1 TrkA family potassium uptake protein [Lachnospiraceae bacterium]MCI1358105.1 TrkA family potassium uptake protein [Lachnospiraceae bacterium]MCI1377985.1 TrkA family potassium uptake protein [Lachnospiraceae bacterium]
MRTVLLIGVGRFGLRIAMRLAEMKVEVMAVDKNEERVKAAVPYVTSGVVGDSTSEEFLKTIGVRNFDECVVAIGDDVLASIETTCQLKELGAKRIIARASKDIHERLLLRNGADEIVFPEKQMANWTALRCGTENIFDYLELNDEYAVFDVKVPDAWCGKSIGQLDIRRRYGLNIMAVKRGSDMEIAVGTDYVLEPGETMLVLGRQSDVQKCFH